MDGFACLIWHRLLLWMPFLTQPPGYIIKQIFQKLARMYLHKYKLLPVVLPHQPQSTEVMTYFLDVYLSGMHPDLFKFRLQIIK